MNQESSETPPDLDPRFQKPEGWRWHTFTNPKGRKLRFGSVAPANRVPEAVVICLQGLSEFTEKYFELAHDLLDRNMSFWMMDWQGQGRSDRHLKNPHKRHSTSFDEDVSDLHYFLMEYVKHSAVHPDVGRIPLVMLGHSMGANIGLRYLLHHPDTFACAAFSSPLINIGALKNLPSWLRIGLTASLQEAMDRSYIEFGGKDWHPDIRSKRAKGQLSTDPIRNTIHDAWCHQDPDLRVGNITYGWLHEANLSCAKLQRKNALKDIQTPCLFAIAGKDKLVDNKATKKAVNFMPHAKLIELDESRHEILMECDSVRDQFFHAFEELLRVNNIKEQLKPF